MVFFEPAFLGGGCGGVRGPYRLRPQKGHHVIDGFDFSGVNQLLDGGAERCFEILADGALEVLVEVDGDRGLRRSDDDPVVAPGRVRRQHDGCGDRPTALDGEADHADQREHSHGNRRDDDALASPRMRGLGGSGRGGLFPPGLITTRRPPSGRGVFRPVLAWSGVHQFSWNGRSRRRSRVSTLCGQRTNRPLATRSRLSRTISSV